MRIFSTGHCSSTVIPKLCAKKSRPSNFAGQFERSVGRFECFDAVEAVDANTLCPDDVVPPYTSVGGKTLTQYGSTSQAERGRLLEHLGRSMQGFCFHAWSRLIVVRYFCPEGISSKRIRCLRGAAFAEQAVDREGADQPAAHTLFFEVLCVGDVVEVSDSTVTFDFDVEYCFDRLLVAVKGSQGKLFFRNSLYCEFAQRRLISSIEMCPAL